MALRRMLVAALVLLASASSARAETDLAEAKRHLEKARAFNDRKQFRAAIQEYELAYRWSDQPNMLFNIGEVYRALTERDEGTREDAEKSLEYFQRFLALRPADGEREKIEKKMAQMRALLKKQQATAARATPPAKRAHDPVAAPAPERAPTRSTPPPPRPSATTSAAPLPSAPANDPPRHVMPRWLLGTELALGAGTALGLALAGVGAYALSQDGRPACALMAPATHCPEVVDSVPTGAALVAVGGVVAVASVAALILVERHARRRDRPGAVTLLPMAGRGAVALQLGGVW